MSIQRLAASVALLFLVGAGSVRAQTASPPADSSSDSLASGQKHRSVWQKLAGRPAQGAAYFSWQTLHLRKTRDGVEEQHFFGATVRGFHAGTFMTSYDDRAYVVGLERVWLRGEGLGFSAQAGYRIGLMYGYTDELTWLAGRTPILPGATVMLDLAWKMIGIQFGYHGIVVTGGGVVRF
jgi:hypothetical protein